METPSMSSYVQPPEGAAYGSLHLIQSNRAHDRTLRVFYYLGSNRWRYENTDSYLPTREWIYICPWPVVREATPPGGEAELLQRIKQLEARMSIHEHAAYVAQRKEKGRQP